MKAEIFTDGSSLGNPGPGGFCAIVKVKGQEGLLARRAAGRSAYGAQAGSFSVGGRVQDCIVKGGDPDTTNNRMEMSAIIAGLYYLNKKFPEIKSCEVVSDSSLIMDTMNKGWKRKKNIDLWKKMDFITSKFDKITWTWVRGHAGHKENTKADEVAVNEAYKQKRTKYQGPKSKE